MTERWKPIPGFEGYYEVSSIGRVRGLDRTITTKNGAEMFIRGRMMSQTQSGRYPTVMLCRDNVYGSRTLHTLVLSAFVGPRPEGFFGCHTNGNVLDNRVENLRWDTPLANVHDMLAHGTHRNQVKTACKRGHDFTPENTYYRKNGSRRCQVCHKAYMDRYNADHRYRINAA